MEYKVYDKVNIFKKTLKAAACIGLAVMISSCTDEMEQDPVRDGNDDYLRLFIGIEQTRAETGEDGSGSFSEGDRIGLYIDNGTDIYYRELSMHDGEWQPLLRRSDFGEGRLAISAHYPISSEVSGSAVEHCGFSIEPDQKAYGTEASDLLLSQAAVEAERYDATLIFRHVMHRLRMEIKGAPADAEIKVRSRLDGVVNMLTGECTLSGTDFQWISPKANGDGSFEAIIFPQPASPYRGDDGTLLKLSANGKEYDFKAPDTQSDGTALEEFEPGKQITIRLSVKDSEESEWANRKLWFYGINPPADDEWKQIYPNLFTTYFLKWRPEYGWYDCNKQNPSAKPGGIPDGMMCWAATASNLIHWWIDRNKTYIDMYGDRYTGPDYAYPQPKAQESDIFQCFIDSFADDAGYGDEGVNWFIHGTIPSYPSRDYPYNDGGYFKDVFPKGVKLCKNVGGIGKQVFNDTVKDALANKKAMGIATGSVTSSHVVSIWGAEFDENGDVSYIYMADNNDRNQFDVWGIGCMRYEISYETLPEGATYTCYKNGFISDDRSITINRLIVLETGEEYWKQYLGM